MSSANELRRLRRERRWSQQELAERSGVSRAEVSAVENARLSPSIATGLALARALGRTVEDVLLSKEAPVGLSARNVIGGMVRAIEEQGGVAMIEVDAKDSIFVRLSHGAVRSLELRPGLPVHLIVKTHSIHRPN